MLSTRSQSVMGQARGEASRLRHEYLGTEHILLGIAREGVGIAADSLKTFGITVDQIRSRVEQIIGIGPPGASPDDRGVSARATRVLSVAEDEAARDDCSQIEPEHLLLGVAREVEGVAVQVLRDLQAPPEMVIERVRGALGLGEFDGWDPNHR